MHFVFKLIEKLSSFRSLNQIVMTRLLETGKSYLDYYPGFAPDLFDYLNRLPLNERPEITVFGKKGHQNRDILFLSDESKGYKYSGQFQAAHPLAPHQNLVDILNHINTHLGTSYNGILINRYNTGADYIGAHSDDETEIDKNKSCVVAISFGATRKFRVRSKKTKERWDFPLEDGSMMIMGGDFQSEFTHEIPKELKIKEARISLTFRCHSH